MVLDRELRLLLQYARLPDPEHDDSGHHRQQHSATEKASPPQKRVPARAILSKLETAWHQTLLPLDACGGGGVNLAELLVLLAEAAIHQRDFATAQRAVDWFLHDCTAKNQFVRAHCTSHGAMADTGAARLRKVLNALHFVLLVLPIACDARKRPQYDFLVYNASVTYWQVARQLMKPATFQFLAPSLAKIVEALRAVGERDVLWVARLQLALVSAQLDTKQFANAAKTANDLVDAQLAPLLFNSGDGASSEQLKALYDAALRAQVHVGSMKDTECQKIVPNVKKALAAATTAGSKRASLLVKLQCLKSGNVEKSVEMAYTEIIQEATGFAAFTLVNTSPSGTNDGDLLSAFLGSLDAKSVETVDAEVIVETGLHAAFSKSDHSDRGHRDRMRYVAHCCDLVLQRKGKSLAPRFRILHQLLKAMLLMSSPATSACDEKRLDAAARQSVALARRVEGIKVLERAILAAKRQEDPTLVESICVYAWNLALPLLQPHLRAQASRVFTLSASLLEEMDSLLLTLRARLHLEIAKLEVSSEFLSKAYESVNKALALDYGVPAAAAGTIDEVASQERKITTRPVDLHLMPLKKKLQWKLDIEDEDVAAAGEKHIRALVESAKETKEAAVAALRALVTQATELLAAEAALWSQSESASPSSPELLVTLWFDVCKLAWEKLKDGAMAEQFAKRGLEVFFTGATALMTRHNESPLRVEKSLRAVEIDFRALLVEILAARIKSRALELDAVKKREQQQQTGRATRGGAVSRLGNRSKDRHSAGDADLAALKLLSDETFVLGMQQPLAKVEVLRSGAEQEGGDAEAIQNHAKSTEEQVLATKRELIEHLVASLSVASHIGWNFVLENTCVYLWNYHFQLFRMLAATTAASAHAFSVQWILPECIAAFEAAYAALETSPEPDSELLASVALGLATIYEKSVRWDKVLVIAEAFLKQKPARVNAVHLMRFAELKTRAQVAQNAKEISPGETVSAFLKVAAYLEALEMSFQQQPQSIDKSQGYYQKAVTLWQSVAGELLAVLGTSNSSITLEEAQNQTEIYVELWTRVAYGALRLQQFRFVVECSSHALAALPLSLDTAKRSRNDDAVALTSSAWRWLAVSEVLCGRAVLALGNGDKTPKKLLLSSLEHLVHGAEYGDRAKAGSVVGKASEVVWNAALMVLNNMNNSPGAKEYEPADVKQVIARLRSVLCLLNKAGAHAAGSANCYGGLVLLTLSLCEKVSDWAESCAVCEDALASGKTSGSLSTDTLNEVRTAAAISSAKLGKQSGGATAKASASGAAGTSRSSSEQQDPLLRAKILKRIAFSSMKDPPAQLKALANAYAELDGRPEEQAMLLMDMAEWFYTTRTSTHDTELYLDSAAKTLLANDMNEDGAAASRASSTRSESSTTSGAERDGSTSVSGSKRDDNANTPVYSALWVSEKLIRVFAMRAMTSSSCFERWGFIEKALHCVNRAWRGIVSIVNEVELQDAFAKIAGGTTPLPDLDYDDWKRSQKVKYAFPHSSEEWLAFYLQYARGIDARFYMEWVTKLQSIQGVAAALHFTDPVVTGYYLEILLTMLRDEMADELMLPAICLYQVLYYGFAPKRSRVMELWLELTLFKILERHNLAACTLAMQSALEIFQSHGQVFIEELQTQSSGSSDASGYVSNGICRPVLESTSVNLREKMASGIELLLEFGYMRQAKTGLEILKYSCTNADDQKCQSEICILTARVYEVEGSADAAAAEIRSALQSSSLDLRNVVQWTIRYCELASHPTKSIAKLQDAEKLLASWLLSTASEGVSSGVAARPGELDVLLWMARLKHQRAVLVLAGSSGGSGGDVDTASDDADGAESRQIFSECVQILTHVNAVAQLGRILVQYSQELLKQSAFAASSSSSRQSDTAHLVKSYLHRAISELGAARQRIGQFYEWSAPAATENADSTTQAVSKTTTALEIEIALAKSLLAKVELSAELSADVVTDHEMTWHAFEVDSKRNIVEKWLWQTSRELQSVPGGNIGLAMASATATHAMLGIAGGLDEHSAMAAVQVLQCQRLALFHNEDKSRSKRIAHKIWTRFSSSDSPHATWICCGNSTTSAAASSGQLAVEDDGSSDTSATSTTAQEDAHVDAFASAFVHQMQQFQKLAFEKRQPELLRVCSLELLQVFGCQRPLDCIRNLLLYQSIAASDHMREIFQRCVAPRDVQQLHLRRLERLHDSHSNAAKHSLPYQISLLYLDQQSSAFKRMSVIVPPETILASLPPHMRVLSLQFSPEKCFIYCAIISSTEKQYAMARMECTAPVMALLTQIRERVRRWRSASAKLLAEFEELHAREADFEFASTDSLAAHSLSSENDALEKEFSAIIVDTTDFFAPLFGHSVLQSVLHSEIPGAALTLLLDRELECLPIEALPAFEKAESIARDFSIHVLHQRLQAQKAQPFKRDDMRFIVDPHHDDTGLDAQTMESVLAQHVKRPGATFASWRDAVEHGQPPTRTDWQHALLSRRGGGLFYLGANRILGSSLSANDLLSMGTALNCHVVCLLDRAENQTSARRQSKVDSEKASWQLALEEDAYANAVLWSLAGVNVFVMNQYATTFNGNRRLASGLFAGLTKGFSIGKALKKYGELVSPTGAVATAPPSTTSSAVSSTSSLPPATTGSSSNSASGSNANSTAALHETESSSTAKLQKSGSRSIGEAGEGIAAAQAQAAAGVRGKQRLKQRLRYNTIVYGLAHIALKSADQ